MPDANQFARRSLLTASVRGAAAIGGMAMAVPAVAHGRRAHGQERLVTIAPQTTWTPEPTQAPATERMIDVGGARLWCWDTGGEGPAVVLMHAQTGSGATWAYQQPVLAAAGYRVIGYSRRGHYRSDVTPNDQDVPMIADLAALVDALGIDKFHLVATAAGGFSLFDFAISHPDRLYSATLASSLGGIAESEFTETTRRLLPPGWGDLPESFRELGPSYRAANPEGTERWAHLAEEARHTPGRYQPTANAITWDALAAIRIPTLALTGDADLYLPPSRLRQILSHMPRARGAILSECGHAAFWEQPEAFNRLVIEHLDASMAAL